MSSILTVTVSLTCLVGLLLVLDIKIELLLIINIVF